VSPAPLTEQLNEAAQASTVVTILYRDAEARWPPTIHRILPIGATKTVLRARELASNRVRVFLLAQLQILSDVPVPAPAPVAKIERPARPRRTTREALASLVHELKRLGWHVTMRGDRLSVHETSPNGKPMKVAAAVIATRPADPREAGQRRRPWSVVTPGVVRGYTFASLDDAVELFMAEARRHAPALRDHRPSRARGR
jgi:hypothetical protein